MKIYKSKIQNYLIQGILFISLILISIYGWTDIPREIPPVPKPPVAPTPNLMNINEKPILSQDSGTFINLELKWKFQTDAEDLGISKKWFDPKFDDAKWIEIPVPSYWEDAGITTINPYWEKDDLHAPYTGYAWYRIHVTIPKEWTEESVFLSLGKIDDHDWTYFNGELVGHTGEGSMTPDRSYRFYSIPSTLIKPGKENVIAIRVFDNRGQGGIYEGPIRIIYGNASLMAYQVSRKNLRWGDVVKTGGSIHITSDEEVNGNVVAIGGNITIDGRVNGDVVSIGGNIDISNTGYVRDEVVCIGGRLNIDPAAIVNGERVSIETPIAKFLNPTPQMKRQFGLGLLGAFFFIKLTLLCMVLISLLIFPQRIQKIAETVYQTPGKSFGIGCLGLILFIPIMLVLIITCIGIPLVPVWILTGFAAWIIAYAALGLLIGRRLKDSFKWNIQSIFGMAALGILLMFLISLIPILGVLVILLIVTAGFGAVILTKFGKEEPGQPGSTVPPIPPVPPTPTSTLPPINPGNPSSPVNPNPPVT